MKKTFEDVLVKCSDERLNTILNLWGVPHEDQDVLFDPLDSSSYNVTLFGGEEACDSLEEIIQLYAKHPLAARGVWEMLTPDEQILLYHLVTPDARNGLTSQRLQEQTGLTTPQLEAARKRLIYYVLVGENEQPKSQTKKKGAATSTSSVQTIAPFPQIVNALYTAGVERFTSEGNRSQQSLSTLLSMYDGQLLFHLKKHYDLGSAPDTLIDTRAQILYALQTIDEPLDYLSQAQGMILNPIYQWLRDRGGQLTTREIAKRFSLTRFRLMQIISLFESFALAFDTLTPQGRSLFIPQEMYKKYVERRKTKSIEQDLTVAPEEVTPPVVHEAQPTVLFDIAMLTNAIYQQTIEPTKDGNVPKRIANKLRPLLGGKGRYNYMSDDMYMEMVLFMMRHLRLVKVAEMPQQDIKPYYQPDSGLADWTQMNLARQMEEVLNHWTSGYNWYDLFGADYQPWDRGFVSSGSLKARTILTGHLRQLRPERWYTIDYLLDQIWQSDPFTLHPYVSQSKAEKKKYSDSYQRWRFSDGELYIGSLASSLYEIGIISLGYSAENELRVNETPVNPVAFRITSEGAAALGMSEYPIVEEAQRTLIVQPNFELLLLQPDLSTLYSLLPFAQANQIGMVSRLTLSRSSLLRGLEYEQSIDQVVQKLEQHSQKELPQNVIYTLHDWSRQYKGVTLSQVLLFKVSSEAAANELCTSSKLKQFNLHQLDSTTLMSGEDIDLSALRRALEKEGVVLHTNGTIFTSKGRNMAASYDRLR